MQPFHFRDDISSAKLGADGFLYGPDIDLLEKVSQMTGVEFSYKLSRFYSGIIKEACDTLLFRNYNQQNAMMHDSDVIVSGRKWGCRYGNKSAIY